jgi:hypothetical protein
MGFVIRSILVVAVCVAALAAPRSAQCASSDPFANYTFESAYGPLREKWLAIIDKLGRDQAVFEACLDSKLTDYAAAQRLGAIIEDAKAQNGLAFLGQINRAINFEIKAVAPSDWLSPFEAINGGGDCKAFSIASILPCARQVLQRITCGLLSCMCLTNRTITWSSWLYGRIISLSLTI